MAVTIMSDFNQVRVLKTTEIRLVVSNILDWANVIFILMFSNTVIESRHQLNTTCMKQFRAPFLNLDNIEAI
jgi:hypothetical protein